MSRNKLVAILYYVAAFFCCAAAVICFVGPVKYLGGIWLCQGGVMLCLGTVYINKAKNDGGDSSA